MINKKKEKKVSETKWNNNIIVFYVNSSPKEAYIYHPEVTIMMGIDLCCLVLYQLGTDRVIWEEGTALISDW